MKLWAVLTIPLYVLDQVTKRFVLSSIAPDEMVPVVPGFFNLVQVHNTGAAFGMLRDNNLFFIALSSVALILLVVFSYRGTFKDGWSRVGAALLAAGILGNLTDRLLYGHVIDFLDFILPWYGRWPAFNVADSCICIAAALFVIASLREGRQAQASAAS